VSGRERLLRHRTELLLLLALLLPIAIPSGLGLDALVSAPLSLVPAAWAGEEDGDARDEWRETAYRLMLENADLRERLLALGEPAGLVPLDPSFYARNPLRVEARVLARDASPWRGSLVLSAGTGEGVAPGQAVVHGRTLIGVVSEAGRFTARVRLLADPGHRVWGVIAVKEGTPREGFLEGSGGDLLEMSLVRAGAAAAGDPVFTGVGLEGVPRGLLIGAVERADDVDRSGIAEVEVRPALDPTRVRIVHVLAARE
jgi:hypothetical protein